ESEGFSFYVEVVFEKLPDYCTHCQSIWHFVNNCNKLHPKVRKPEEAHKNTDEACKNLAVKQQYGPRIVEKVEESIQDRRAFRDWGRRTEDADESSIVVAIDANDAQRMLKLGEEIDSSDDVSQDSFDDAFHIEVLARIAEDMSQQDVLETQLEHVDTDAHLLEV
ncbi:DEAD-box ATP-dependent RNA helicase, partial [Trifolium medium]|nr:DEAD-box ATP-dependent RNA helicase [Trifolium medium]